MKITINNEIYFIKKIKRKDYYGYFLLSQTNDFVSSKKINTLEEAKEQFFKIYFSKDHKENYTYKIISKQTKKIIGFIELHSYNKSEHTISIGYFLDKQYWNKGIMKASTKAVIDLIIKKHQYTTIYAQCFSDNYASKKILEYLNFQLKKITITKTQKELYNFKLERSFYNDPKTKRNL